VSTEPPTLSDRLLALVRVYGPCSVPLLAVALQIPRREVLTLAQPLVEQKILDRAPGTVDALVLRR